MRDLLSKLDSILNETALNPKDPKGDYDAKKQALADLANDPAASKEPEIVKAIDQRQADLDKEAKDAGVFEMGDAFGISISEDLEICTEIVDILEDGVMIELDEYSLDFLSKQGFTFEDGELDEEKKKGTHGKACWKGYRRVGTNDCTKIGESQEGMDEAEYRGKNVPLGKKLPGDVKKSKVYVRKPNGNIVKVNFGDKKMRIKKSNPARRKSFRARHNCKNPGPRWKARYWSCRSW